MSIKIPHHLLPLPSFPVHCCALHGLTISFCIFLFWLKSHSSKILWLTRVSSILGSITAFSRPQLPRGVSAVARLLGLRVPIPPGGHECLSLVSVSCCHVERPLPQADHSSRGVRRVWCVRVWSRNLTQETQGPQGLQNHIEREKNTCFHR